LCAFKKISEGYAIVLSADVLKELNLVEGSVVELRPVETESENARPVIRYASTDEALAAFERTVSRHDWTYRELAK
jgi:antitoxin component of MazEF toxin-antitoxin module